MRSLCFALCFVVPCTVLLAQDAKDVKPSDKMTEFKSNKEKVSYAIGLNVGRQFQQQGLNLDVENVALGIATILNGEEPVLTPEEMQAAFKLFEEEMNAQQAKLSAENMAAAEKFLAENAKKPGVKTTKSGLQYTVLSSGSGATPTARNTVSTHYRGKLLSGKVFDESYKGEAPTAAETPVSFPVTGVIPGWTEALQLMKEGDKFRLFIKPELAYGERGPGSIGPNSLLIFDIELLSVKLPSSDQ